MSGYRVTIFDTTLRDGEQAPGFSFRMDEKLQLARQLDRLGVDVIEAGFPIASDADAEAVRLVATKIRRPIVAALARCAGRHRARGVVAQTRRPIPHPHLPRHLRSPPHAQAANDARGMPRDRGAASNRRGATRTTCSSRRRMRRGATRTFSVA